MYQRLALFPFFVFIGVSLQAQSIEVMLQNGHAKKINCMASSTDGRYFATGSQDQTIKVWDFALGIVVKSFEGHAAGVTDLQFSADGKYLISSSYDKTIRIWEFVKNPDNKILDKQYAFLQAQAVRYDMITQDGVKAKLEEALAGNYYCLQTYTGHKEAVRSVSIDKEMKNMVSVSADNSLLFWDPLNEKALSTQSLSEQPLQIRFTPDGSKYFVVSGSSISIFKSSSHALLYTFKGAAFWEEAAAGADKKYIAARNKSNEIYIWDQQKGTEISKISSNAKITGLAFHPLSGQLVYGTTSSLVLVDPKTGTELQRFNFPDQNMERWTLSGDGKSVAALTQSQSLLFIDLTTGKLREERKNDNVEYTLAAISKDWKYTVSYSPQDRKLYKSDLFTGKLTSVEVSETERLCLSPNGTEIALAGTDGQVKVFSSEELQQKAAFTTGLQSIKNLLFDSEGNDILLLTSEGKWQKWDWRKAQKVKEQNFGGDYTTFGLPAPEVISRRDQLGNLSLVNTDTGEEIFALSQIANAEVGFSATQVAAVNKAGNLEVWSRSPKKKVKEIGTGLKAEIRSLQFSQDGKYLAALFADGRIKIFEIINAYEVSRRVAGKRLSQTSTALAFSPNDKWVFTLGTNNIIQLWQWKEDKDMRQINSRNGSVLITPDHYYIVSNKGLDLINFKKGDNYYSFEQFDLHYNRPDKVLQTLGYAPEALVNSYRQAYNKRLKKMGFKNSFQGIGIQVPTLTISNLSTLPATTTQEKIQVNVQLQDNTWLLKSYSVWVNGVPVWGLKGTDISDKKVKTLVANLEIELSQGENEIKISCMNEKGAESYRQTLNIFCDKPKRKPDLYLVLLGASKYKNESMNLQYAAKDAQDVAAMMLQKKQKYGSIFIDSLMNERLNLEALTAIKKRLATTRVDDQVIVFYAGHGLLDANLDYFLATYEVDFMNPALGGLPYDKLEELLDGIPARNKLMLIDACHSGEVDKDELALKRETTRETGEVNFRSVPNQGVQRLGLENSFEMMKILFADLRKNSGTQVISSAGGAEYALEGKEWNNGVFTYCLLQGLGKELADLNKDGAMYIAELQEYLQKNVVALTQGKQRPTSRKELWSKTAILWK